MTPVSNTQLSRVVWRHRKTSKTKPSPHWVTNQDGCCEILRKNKNNSRFGFNRRLTTALTFYRNSWTFSMRRRFEKLHFTGIPVLQATMIWVSDEDTSRLPTSATFFFFLLAPLLLSSSSFCFRFFCSSFFFLYFSSNCEIRSGQSRFSKGSHVFSVLQSSQNRVNHGNLVSEREQERLLQMQHVLAMGVFCIQSSYKRQYIKFESFWGLFSRRFTW